jgi:hypothetical protein
MAKGHFAVRVTTLMRDVAIVQVLRAATRSGFAIVSATDIRSASVVRGRVFGQRGSSSEPTG